MTRQANHTFDSSNTRYNIERLLKVLATPHTYEELTAALHMSHRSVSRYVNHLREKPNRRVYIKAYPLINSRYHPAFQAGSKADAVQPKMTQQAISAKWRAKVKASPELRQRLQARERARWIISQARKTPQSWLSALGAI